MGWMLPLVHKAKRFLQSLWKENWEWDTPLPNNRTEQWKAICRDIHGFQKTIPRFLSRKFEKAQLVLCADASSDAFAACAYLCSSSSTSLLMAKGKLPSIKSKTTIPKLELNALLLAMKLSHAVISQITSVAIIERVLILSDSEIALNWIKANARTDTGPFIRNRVWEIHKIVNDLETEGHIVQFGHISSEENPADCATRGLDKEQLHDHFWWNGPRFLTQPTTSWESAYSPVNLQETNNEVDLVRHVIDSTVDGPQSARVFTQSKHEYSEVFSEIRRSDFNSVQRIVALALRFACRLVARVNAKRTHPIKLSTLFDGFVPGNTPVPDGREVELARKAIVKQHQRAWISPSITKSLKHLKLYEDEQGILRCRGRLGRSDLDEHTKFPMLILQKTWLSAMIIKNCHSDLHTSISHTMCRVRERYWIPKLRAETTKVIRRCTACQKMNNLPYKYPDQGQLPARRVTRSRPFEHIGLDYFGPLSVKGEETPEKCYGCIITCLATRLIHLDLVTDVSTVAFLHMLRRFFSRRGIPKSITSDNAPTFALGDAILSEWMEKARDDPTIAKELSARQIQWIYITPYAPWQGGVYERLIRSIKLAMYKSVGKATPAREELATLIVEIEGMLNTRPLLYVESEEGLERVLRPIDFLQNEFEVLPSLQSEARVEDIDYLSPAERLASQTKLQVVQAIESSMKITEQFWQKWQSQYLTSLRERHQINVGNKRGARIVPKEGQVVLIHDALQPRHTWKMGRISKLVFNEEGIAREALVILPSRRKIRRPVNLLVPLELDDDANKNPEDNCSNQVQGSSMSQEDRQEQPQEAPPPYALRPKRRVDYKKLAGLGDTSITPVTSIFSVQEATVEARIQESVCQDKFSRLDRNHKVCRIYGVSSLQCVNLRQRVNILLKSLTSVRDETVHYESIIRAIDNVIELIVDYICFRMASTSPEYQFLARMWKREDLAWKNVENEMRKIRSDYSKESNKWTSTYYSWTELSSNTSTHPQACVMKFIVSEKLLRDCIVHRQVFARLAHQYITLGLVYQEEARQQSKATQEQLNNDVRGMMADFDDMLQKLEQTIAELEKVVHEKEATLRREPFREHVRPFFDSLWQSFENARRKDCEIQEKIYQLEDQVNAYKTQVAEFERHTKAHKEGQARLKQAIEKCNQDEREARQEVERLKTEVDSLKAEMARIRQQPDQGCEIEVGVSDEEHFIRMVEEVREAEPLELPADADDDQEEEMDLRSEDGSDDDAPEPEPAQPAQIEPQIEQDEDAEYARRETELRQRVDNLQNRITRMIADYYRFPFRKSEWESPGIHPDLRCLFCGEVGRHYSESCPRVTDGDERYFIIRNMGACDYCMEFCRGTCRYRFRRCFYCERVRGTMFEELMPEDNGHHSALCSIPGKKKRAKRMINDHEDALRRLLGELQRMVERRARAARGRGGPREGGAE
ncbi:hypothetical protein Q1695_005341 [Nippostrongylus brasiliensis]|nr:hypothetical protein Q1695_005341 [Nippostrongylus brasiliensis]